MISYEYTFENVVPAVQYSGLTGFSGTTTHIHRHVETQYVFEGTGYFTVDGKEYECHDGFLFIFPYQPHSGRENLKARQYAQIINPNSFSRYAPTLFGCIPENSFIPSDDLSPEFPAMMRYAYRMMSDTSNPNREQILYDITSVIMGEALSKLKLIHRSDESGTRSLPPIGRVINYCMTHLSDDMSLGAVSEALFLDKCYISRLFSSKLGTTYTDFINSQRTTKACELLVSTDRQITDIAFECGFRNQSTFNRVFREMTGMSPREYRTKD